MLLDGQMYVRIYYLILLKSLWFPLMHNLCFRECPRPCYGTLSIWEKAVACVQRTLSTTKRSYGHGHLDNEVLTLKSL